MAAKKFKFHGAFKTKAAARRREKSAPCHDSCFILKRMVRKAKRFIVLERL